MQNKPFRYFKTARMLKVDIFRHNDKLYFYFFVVVVCQSLTYLCQNHDIMTKIIISKSLTI